MKEILEKVLNVKNETLNLLDTKYANMYNLHHDIRYFHLPSGTEHYRLLMYISSLLDHKLIYDIGTYRCLSSIALSYTYKNKIKSFDVARALPMNPIIPNVSYYIQDVTTDPELINSNLAFLDVYHDGIFEDKFYAHLHEIGWKGLLILDDIHLNDPMKRFWSEISEDKYDITSIGHWSGTGLVHFK